MPIFRKLQKEDEAGLLALLKQLTQKRLNLDINLLLSDPASYCFVLEENKKIIGSITLTIFSTPTKGLTGIVNDVVVDAEYRGRGLGKKLVEEIIRLAKAKKITQLNLTSSPEKVAAHKLYESLGFIKLETDVFRLYLSELSMEQL